jgi:hypothetical protein
MCQSGAFALGVSQWIAHPGTPPVLKRICTVLKAPSVTYHSQGPENCVVEQQPCLLSEADNGLSFSYSSPSCKGFQDVFHNRHSHARENDNPENNKGNIFPTLRVFACGRIVIGELEEGACVLSGTREADVREEKEK